eukprot:4175762-Prorocentrum_lima.AAC.1
MSIARELQQRVTRVPATMAGPTNWLGDYASKLELGMKLGCRMEPRAILTWWMTMEAVES